MTCSNGTVKTIKLEGIVVVPQVEALTLPLPS